MFYRKIVHGHVRVLSEVDKKVISSIKDKPSLTIKELAVICSKSEKNNFAFAIENESSWHSREDRL